MNILMMNAWTINRKSERARRVQNVEQVGDWQFFMIESKTAENSDARCQEVPRDNVPFIKNISKPQFLSGSS